MRSQLWKTSKLVSLSRDLGLRHLSNSVVAFSGHNKWSKIKQKKGVMDAQKGAIYGKANRDIVLAARTGGSADPVKNLALAAAIRWAKEQDVPKENIEKALAKATKGKDQGGEHLTYEALAFGSVGIIMSVHALIIPANNDVPIHNIESV
ncbi:transcriptional regulator-domain-containing protein [Infundibulicybe gibba]|nr:transcriptional regulator-domain-containing protein [Infundibulicybe gibba]